MTLPIRVHAGAIVGGPGATLLVGSSGAGKSTLVARLIADGYGFLSDDEVAIDTALVAYESRRPLLLKEGAWDLFPSYRGRFLPAHRNEERAWWLTPENVRPRCRAVPTRVACLIFLMPPDGRSLPSLTELGETDALESLLREVMNFPEVGASALATLIALVKRTRRFRLANGELDERAERVAAAASAPDWRSARSG